MHSIFFMKTNPTKRTLFKRYESFSYLLSCKTNNMFQCRFHFHCFFVILSPPLEFRKTFTKIFLNGALELAMLLGESVPNKKYF